MVGEIIDALIAPFAPHAALRRSFARAELRTYQAADRGRQNKDWNASSKSADASIIPDSRIINARARQMICDSQVAKAIQLSKVRNIVGRGITPIPVARDLSTPGIAGQELTVLNKSVEHAFWVWSNSPALCDVEGRRTFWQMQALAVSEKVIVGEVFFVKCYRPGIGLQLKAVESEQLNETIQRYGDNEVRGGVEIDGLGKAIAYHFWARNPNDYLAQKSIHSERIERDRVIHYFKPDRVMQARGVSELAPVMQLIRNVKRRDDAELMKSIMEACHGASIIRARGRNGGTVPGLPRTNCDNGTTAGGLPTFDYAPGMVFEGEPGDEIKFHAPTTPGNAFEPYTRQNLRGIGAGVDLSYEQINRDFSQGTFSSQRQSLLEDQRAWNPEQDHLTDTMVAPIWEDWYRFAVIEQQIPLTFLDFIGDPKRFIEAEFVTDGHDWIDPEKELNGYEKAIQLRLMTRKEIIGGRGGRYRRTFEQIAEERTVATGLGIEFPEDVVPPVASASAAPAPAVTQPVHPSRQPPPAAPAPSDTGVNVDQSLNGAQITSAVDVVSKAGAGVLAPSVATELLIAVGIPREKAMSMIADTTKN